MVISSIISGPEETKTKEKAKETKTKTKENTRKAKETSYNKQKQIRIIYLIMAVSLRPLRRTPRRPPPLPSRRGSAQQAVNYRCYYNYHYYYFYYYYYYDYYYCYYYYYYHYYIIICPAIPRLLQPRRGAKVATLKVDLLVNVWIHDNILDYLKTFWIILWIFEEFDALRCLPESRASSATKGSVQRSHICVCVYMYVCMYIYIYI